MKVYLAGPMTGIPEFNFPAFRAAADYLRGLGHEVFSPAEADVIRAGRDFSKEHPEGRPEAVVEFTRREALAEDLQWICQHADAIALLPGWEQSSGSRAEHATAAALGLKFIYL